MKRHSAFFVCVASLTLLQSGCSIVSRVSAFIDCKVEKKHLMAEQRQLEIEAMRHQRALEREALRTQSHNERESLTAQHDLDVQASQNQFKDRIKTKLALDLDQKLDVGELQVDEKKLAEMLQKRSEEREALKKTYDAFNDQIKAKNRESLIKQATEALTRGEDETARGLLASCNQPVPPTCARPGETEALTREPLVKPLTPEEIPFMLPITVSVGLGGSRLEKSALLREPLQKESLKKPCCQPGCVQHENCVPGQCVQGAAPAGQNAMNGSPTLLHGVPVSLPVPVPGAEDAPGKSPEARNFDADLPTPLSSAPPRSSKLKSLSLRRSPPVVSKASHTSQEDSGKRSESNDE